jgi:hypothetical protein
MVDGVDNLAGIDPLEIDRRDPKMGMPELSLDDRQRDPFVRHLDRMSVPELVRREPAPDASLTSEPSKLTSRGGRGPSTAAGTAGEDAEQRADRQPHAMLGPAADSRCGVSEFASERPTFLSQR